MLLLEGLTEPGRKTDAVF